MFRSVLADDLSGAADSSALLGRRVRISLWPAAAWDPNLDSDIIQVHDTESRSLTAAEAALRVAAACGLLPWPGLYKKIDSTLRGNPGAEIAAALKATGTRTAVVAPSLPGQGRTVAGGILMVDGKRITKTSFAHDARTPVRHDRVADLLRSTADLQVVEIDARGLDACTAQVAVVDAASDADLDAIAAQLSADMLPVGSAGLARAIAGRGPGRGGALPTFRSVVVLAGSGHPLVSAQVAAITRSGRVAIRMNSSLQALTDGLLDLLHERPVAVVATGGETALAVCRALGVEALWPQGEVAAGIPWSLLEGVEGVTLVTKAGGFGSATTLRDMVGCLLGTEADG